MPSEWPLVRLGDHVESCLGKMLDAKKNKGTPHPYLGNSNVRWGSFDLADLAEMRFEPHEEERYSLTLGDLVVCEGGEPGRCAIWNSPVSGMKIQKALHRIRPKETLNNHYLYYWFCCAAKAGLLEPYFTGTTIKHLTGKAITALEVPLPPVDIQVAMVEALRSLDDKIALLRETNATLEAIAQALFKSWFVDFDPVRAKAEGLDPEGVPPEVADLFPGEFEDSELGEIPKGWRVGTFADITDAVGGATPSTKEPAYWEEGRHCWATPKDLSGMDTPVLLDTERKITDAGLAKISSGLLPVGTVLMSSRAPIGYLAIAEVPVAVNQGFIAMKPKAGISNLFLLNLLRAQMDEIKSHANGSTFMEISKAAFRPLKVVVPPIPVIQAFDDVARSLYERMVGNVRQIANLTELRDTLLPRLMSGKLRIPESQEAAEEATA